MSNLVAIAISTGARLYGTTDKSFWYITFMTSEMKRGQLTALEDGFFSLQDGRTVCIFHSNQVVHVSPQFPPGASIDSLQLLDSPNT